MKKREVRNVNDIDLIKNLIRLYNDLDSEYPMTNINFNFNKDFYKKNDISNIKKMKRLVSLLEEYLLVVQELRSRNKSLMDITDLEIDYYGLGILTKSFKETL